MLENGFGEHNIQGIGDKHIPLIHNVMNTDVVVGDLRPGDRRARPALQLRRRPRACWPARASRDDVIAALAHFGFSSTCNVLAAIKTAKLLDLGPDDAIITVATDGGAMYPSERAALLADALRRRRSPTSTRPRSFGRHLADVDTDGVDRLHRARPHADLQPRLLHVGRAAGHAVRAVRAAPQQAFWRGLRRYLGVWDEMITEFNARVGCVVIVGLALRRLRHDRRRRHAVPVHVPAGDADRPAPRAAPARGRAAGRAARRPQPVRRATGRAWPGGRSPAPTA